MSGLHRTGVVAGILGLVLLLLGCSTSREDIDKWADAVGGEERIVQTLRDPGAELDVRAYAMLKMIRLRDFARLDTALGAMEVEDRNRVIRAGAEEIGKLLTFPDMSVQAAAKDALYLFLKIDNELVSRSARQALLIWYGTDFDKKFAAGTYSAFHVLTELGLESSDLVIQVMRDYPEMRSRVARIAEALNDPALFAKMDGLYLEWFNPEQDAEAASTVLSLACFARGDAFTDRLNAYVADRKNPYDLRRKAMNTLTYRANPRSLPMVMARIADSGETGDMRGLALEILEKTGGPEQARELLPQINDPHIRWFAFKAAVVLGGVERIAPMLTHLRPGAKLWREDYDFAAEVIAKTGEESASIMVPFLKSADVNVVAIALLSLERLKATRYREEVAALLPDTRPVPRYEASKPLSVGELAFRVREVLGSSE